MTDYELRSLYFTHNKELLSKYAKHKNAEFRRAVAWNKYTDEADLLML